MSSRYRASPRSGTAVALAFTAAAILTFALDSDRVALAQDSANVQQAVTGSAIPCVNGRAKGFDCQNVDLLAFLPFKAIGGERAMSMPDEVGGPRITGGPVALNVVWGWIDSTTGREFALVGQVDAIAFVEVTDPVNPKYLGELPFHGDTYTLGRDVKVYKNHAFVVADAGSSHGISHGM